MPFRRAFLAATALIALAAPSAAYAGSAPAPGQTSVLADCEHPRVEPYRIFIACGDGALILTVDHYSYWRDTGAVGYGAIHANDCDPDCAGGTFLTTKARFRFYAVRTSSQGPVFSRVVARWHHNGRLRHERFGLSTDPITGRAAL